MCIYIILLNLIHLHEVLLCLTVDSQFECIYEPPDLFNALFYVITYNEIAN